MLGKSRCPELDAVQEEIARLTPPEGRDALIGSAVEVVDQGDTYQVEVRKEGSAGSRSYSDPARQCHERARFAAVFAFLSLMPPSLGGVRVDAETSPPAEVPEHREPIEAAKPSWVRVELAALGEWAPALGRTPHVLNYGGELRGVFGKRAIVATVAVGYHPARRFDLADRGGRLTRIPTSIGALFRTRSSPLHLTVGAELVGVVERVEGVGFLTPESGSGFDLGFRPSAQLMYCIGSSVCPFFGARLTLLPRPRQLVALPRGVMGRLPRLWLGIAVGVSVSL